MYRVELKGKDWVKPYHIRLKFLMYRVELKGHMGTRFRVSVNVPNVPCGVERAIAIA